MRKRKATHELDTNPGLDAAAAPVDAPVDALTANPSEPPLPRPGTIDPNAASPELPPLGVVIAGIAAKIDAHRAETAKGFARAIALIREANAYHAAGSKRRSRRTTRRS